MNALIKVMALVCLFTWAAVVRADNAEFGNINKGNIQADGAASVSNYAPTGQTSSFIVVVSPSVQYFVMNRVSIGGSLYFQHYSSGASWNALGIGPSATWHFWSEGHLSASVSDGLTVNENTNSRWYLNNSTGLGLNYFITPSVAIGPALVVSYQFSSLDLPAALNTSVVVKFSIYF